MIVPIDPETNIPDTSNIPLKDLLRLKPSTLSTFLGKAGINKLIFGMKMEMNIRIRRKLRCDEIFHKLKKINLNKIKQKIQMSRRNKQITNQLKNILKNSTHSQW